MKVLVFAPHPDDEILGCGGMMARYVAEGADVYVCIATCSKVEKYRIMHERYARTIHEKMGVKETFFLNHPTVELTHIETREFNRSFADVVKKVMPDVVYIPFFGDMHSDHAMVADAAMVALRPLYAPYVKDIYMYETLSETGWNYPTSEKAFIPNVFADVSGYIEDKVNAMEMYETKVKTDPHPRSPEGIRALAKYRGGTIGVDYAEAFMCIRSIV